VVASGNGVLAGDESDHVRAWSWARMGVICSVRDDSVRSELCDRGMSSSMGANTPLGVSSSGIRRGNGVGDSAGKSATVEVRVTFHCASEISITSSQSPNGLFDRRPPRAIESNGESDNRDNFAKDADGEEWL
jgi:hypothetical protein